MSNYFEWLVCKICDVKIDAKDYNYEESQKSICQYCLDDITLIQTEIDNERGGPK